MIPLYIYGFPDHLVNVFLGEKQFVPNYWMCLALVLWTGAQVGMLVLQQRFGPQFFVPARFLPPKYSYTRPIPRTVLEDAEESGVECVICYSTIEMHPSKRDSFTTPCDHVFHEECLRRWMEQKMEWYAQSVATFRLGHRFNLSPSTYRTLHMTLPSFFSTLPPSLTH